MDDQHLIARIRAEFLEMPGLHLTLPQACRLWHLDEHACRAALGALVRELFLVERSNGSFTRASEGPRQAPRMPRIASASRKNDRRVHRQRPS
jgi:hypothetical protein